MKMDDPKSAWKQADVKNWTKRHVAHLYRRAGFAATPDELKSGQKLGLEKCVDRLFNVETTKFDSMMKKMGATLLAARETRSLSAWWLYRMRFTPDQLLEKMTLFWHGHFATSAAKVNSADAMLDQNRILRNNALGKFEKMVSAIARDPAMLIYLDSQENRKTRPNENFARELMELFCLESGNYTETDIKQMARCFTGWEIRRKKFRFNPYQHDNGVKKFLSQSGNFGGEDAIKIVLAQAAAPRFIAKKLYRFFIADEPTPSPEMLEPLAQEIRKSNFDMGKTVRKILLSNIFYSKQSIGKKLRSPVEFAVGLKRALGASVNLNELANRLEQLGQLPFYPPNVAGWEGGRKWINSSTLLGRANLVGDLVRNNNTKWADSNLAVWLRKQNAARPEQAVDSLLELLVAVPIPGAAKSKLVRLAEKRGVKSHDAVADLIHAISLLPEFQLS